MYVSRRVRDMLKRRSGGACERCKREFKDLGECRRGGFGGLGGMFQPII
jgi:hypothetical protein